MQRLPRGRHGLSPEYVARNQRERLLSGLTQALYEEGYESTTVALIGQRAAVSKSDFYKHFDSKDECFLAAYEAAIESIRERMETACASATSERWADRVAAAIEALLNLLTLEPALASMALVEGIRAGRHVYGRYQAALDSFVRDLREGAPASPAGGEVPEAMGEAVVGGVAAMLGRRILAGETDQLPQLFPEILEFVLTAYLGAEEARRIVSAG